MKKQISEATSWFCKPITEKPATPANKNLFNSVQDFPELNAEKSDIFHSMVQKLLYITKYAQPDIQTVVSYLCIRVSKSTDNDWRKLRRFLGFFQNTINDVHIIGTDSLENIFT